MLKISKYLHTILCFSAIGSFAVGSLTLAASASDRQISAQSLPKVSLIAGTNVSNGGGSNVSNTTGTNVSNTTGTNVSNTSGTNASNATGADVSARADKILSRYTNALSDYDRAAAALAQAESTPGNGNRNALITAKAAAASELAKVRAEAQNFVETAKPNSGNAAKGFNPSW